MGLTIAAARRVTRIAAVCAFALGVIPSSASGTIVLVLRSDDGILVAADTVANTGSAERPKLPYCKVIVSDHAIVAFGGLNGLPALKIDVRQPLELVAARNLPYRELLAALDHEMSRFLPFLVDSTILLVPEFAHLLEARRGHVLTILTAGIENGGPLWRSRQYFRVAGKDGVARYRFEDTYCDADCKPGRTEVLEGGRRTRRAFARADVGILQHNWAREARRLVGMAARESPATIGLPAVSLELTAKGVRWLEGQPFCGPP